MEIVGNAALKLRLSQPHRVLDAIEKSKVIKTEDGVSEVLVYWGLDEALKLNNLNIRNVPSPIERDYNWPGLFTPFSHQKTTASFLTLNRKAFCFNEAGTGKTSSVIWAADYLMTEWVIRRVLVICPLSIMYSAWQADLFKVAMHRTVGIAYGSADKRKQIISGGYEFVVINYDGLSIVRDEIKNSNFDLIIVDEANAYKNVSTKRWKILNNIIKPSGYLWLLTGTPASQSPMDAFGLAKLVNPDGVPRFVTVWRDKVMYQVSKFKYMPKTSSKQIVYEALQPAIRFTKEECLDLPDVLYQTRDVALTSSTYRYYSNLKSELLIEAAGENISAVNAAAKLSKLLQISGGAVYTDDREVVRFDVTPRLTVLEEVIDETNNKVLVFVPYRHTIDLVTEHLNTKKITTETISGDVSATKRSDIFHRFQTAVDPKVLVIQPQAASHGVTLTAADTVIFWSPVMSVETYLQCIARIDRVGQKNKMTVVHLQGSDAERRMYLMLQSKVDSHEKLVDLYKQEMGLP